MRSCALAFNHRPSLAAHAQTIAKLIMSTTTTNTTTELYYSTVQHCFSTIADVYCEVPVFVDETATETPPLPPPPLLPPPIGRCQANARERYRTQSVNSAFGTLRDMIPTEPLDRKLSKIETLRLAQSYIEHLAAVLSTGQLISPCSTSLRQQQQTLQPPPQSTRPPPKTTKRRSNICTFCVAGRAGAAAAAAATGRRAAAP